MARSEGSRSPVCVPSSMRDNTGIDLQPLISPAMNDVIVWIIIAAFYAPLHYLSPALFLFITVCSTARMASFIALLIVPFDDRCGLMLAVTSYTEIFVLLA